MGHDSAKLGQDGAKMASLSSTWEVLDWFREHFSVIWAYGLDSEKLLKTLGFLRFFEVLGWLEGMIEASWGWNRTKILFWVDCLMHFWTCWRQDGEKDGQDGDQEAQDGRWEANDHWITH